MKQYKNWCNAISASKRVETVSKSSVQYVYQMAIYMIINMGQLLALFYVIKIFIYIK